MVMVRTGLLFLVLLLGISGCAFFGENDEVVILSPSPMMPLSAEPVIRVTLVEQDDLGADLFLTSDRLLEEDVWVYLRLFIEGKDGDLFKTLVPAGVQGRKISFPRELFFSTPVFVQVFPCQDRCYKAAGEPVSLFH